MYLSTTDKLEIVLSSAVAINQLQWNVSYQDITSAGMTLPQASGQGLTNDTSSVDLVTAPAAATTRQVVHINVYNDDTAPVVVTIRKDVSGTEYILVKITLQTTDTLEWSRESGWSVISGTSASRYTFDVFTANGTWTKPANLKAAFIFCGGAGGGGGSGARNAASSNRFGGGGGGGGALSWQLIDAGSLPSTVTVTVGTGGTGAAGATVDTTAGTGGTAGTDTSFGGTVVAKGGSGGGGGSTTAGTAGAGGLATTSTIPYGAYSIVGAAGTAGTTNTTSTAGVAGLGGNTGAPGGAGGSGISSTNTSATTAGSGGAVYQNGILQAGPTAGATPNGVNNVSDYLHFNSSLTSNNGIGTGGAGGYPAFVDAGNGGYCAGGGGGSGVLNGTTSGKGGNGGGGICIVMNIF